MIDVAIEVYESSNKKSLTSLYSFVSKNKWFNGKLWVLTNSKDHVSAQTILSIQKIYYNIEVINITLDSDFIGYVGENSKDSSYTKLKAILIDSQRVLYFSNTSLFLSNIEYLVKPRTGFMAPDASVVYLDLPHYDTAILRESFKNDTPTNTLLKLPQMSIISNTLLIQASSIPDDLYTRSAEKLAAAKIISFDIFTSKFTKSTRITSIWLHSTREVTGILASPISMRVKNKPIYTAPPKSGAPKGTGILRNSPFVANILKIDEADYVVSDVTSSSLSIIIPAYRAQDYIEACLDSIFISKNKNIIIEVLIGIDNCESTRDKLFQILPKYSNVKVFYSEKSVGAYILRNSLASFATHQNLLFFDADDIMHQMMLRVLLSRNNGVSALRFKYINFKDGENPVKSTDLYKNFAHGVFFIPKATFDKIGGFQPWTCAADTEFMRRCEQNKISTINIPTYVFYRRIHPNSLTQHASTNHRSGERAKNAEWIKRNTNWRIPITRTTTNLIQL